MKGEKVMSDLNFKTLLLIYIFVFTLAIILNSRRAKRFMGFTACVLSLIFLEADKSTAVLAMTISLNFLGVLYEILLRNLPVKRKVKTSEVNKKNNPGQRSTP
jgi:hypothetical protein